MRIVSLVPSLSEFIETIKPGVLCGITRFCVHPPDLLLRIPAVGGTKNPDVEKIISLRPDLVVANHEENRKDDVEQLQSAGIPVLVTTIGTINEAFSAMQQIGGLIGETGKVLQLCTEIDAIRPATCSRWVRTAYFIWRKPWMCAGAGTFITSVMERFELDNIFSGDARYPTIDLEDLAAGNPELVLLSSEPFPFKKRHLAEIRAVVPGAEIQLVDGEAFSWYGNRMLPSFKMLAAWRETVG